MNCNVSTAECHKTRSFEVIYHFISYMKNFKVAKQSLPKYKINLFEYTDILHFRFRFLQTTCKPIFV